MELRQLRYLVAVYAEQSISRAAADLVLTQPALTRQISALERELGVRLFDRVPSGVRATAAGAAVHAHALHVLRMVDQTPAVARSAAAARERVDIGLAPGLPDGWMREALARVRRELPQVGVGFVDAGSPELIRMISEGRLDIGLVHLHPPESFRRSSLWTQPFGFAIRPGHPLARRPTCTVRDLHGVGVLVHSREQIPIDHDRMVLAAQQAGVAPNWHFLRFQENALLCADAAAADAVLVSERTMRVLLPEWTWHRLVEPELELVTWVTHQGRTRRAVRAVADVLERLAGESQPDW